MYLIADIETVPDTSLWQPPPEDPDAFPPHVAHRPIAIGYAILDAEYALVEIDAFVSGRGLAQPNLFATPGERDQDTDEHELLLAFSRRVNNLAIKARADRLPFTVVGFNSRGFDIPVLTLRALKYAVPMPWVFRDPAFNTRYKDTAHLDLADAISFHGAAKMTSLDRLARLCGLPGKSGCDGSMVAGMYERGEIDRIVSYVLSDVAQTALLLVRWRAVQHDPAVTFARVDAALRAAFASDPRIGDIFRPADMPAASNA